MKTPDEIKKGLEHCVKMVVCSGCPYSEDERCDRGLYEDALAYIQRLERERDAAIGDIQHFCTRCAHREHRFLADGKLDDRCGTCVYNGMYNWQWRGAQEVE